MAVGEICNAGEVKVTGIGEITAEPDCCTAEFVVCSRKPTSSAAEESARKRAEYARQEINSRCLKKCNIVEHFDIIQEGTLLCALYKFEITTCDISGIKSLLGHLKCKLPSYVKLGSVRFFFSKKRLFEIRKEAVAQAVSDAKHKAELIASAFGQRIQGLINVIENECDSNCEQQVMPASRSNGYNSHHPLKQLNTNNSNNDNNNIACDGGDIFEGNCLQDQPFNWNASLSAAQRHIQIKLNVVCALSDFNN
uniref:Uncharacterized protein n=1 Tax=Trichobilharzia regenti TaxID=157069 RepID=A0AA85J200_TRIRE|nr:unnamed protein product [Trichobilharzia regenti]